MEKEKSIKNFFPRTVLIITAKYVCETATFNARNILKCIYTYITWQFSLRIYKNFLIP